MGGTGRGKSPIAIATSIPPALKRQDAGKTFPGYQQLCVQSWARNGFRILSVNDPQEIPALADLYPEVEFVAAHRNASEWTGRKTPYIADLLEALKGCAEPVVGIVNSDLLFEPTTAWAHNLPGLVETAMVVAHRYNTPSLSSGALRRYYGLDCFFFDKTTAECILEDPLPYAMGVPWWDCWLPCMALLHRRDIVVVDRPAILHLSHSQAYSQETWREFAKFFSQSLIRGMNKADPPVPPLLTEMLPLLREILRLAEDSKPFGHVTAKFGNLFISRIRTNSAVWPPDPQPAPESAEGPDIGAFFQQFDDRAAAGQALGKAKKLITAKKWAEIGPETIAALNKAAPDVDVLLTLGEISFQSGNLEAAREHLAAASELAPEMAFPRHMLGTVLARKGRDKEALECFRTIMNREPGNEAACTAAGKILWKAGDETGAIALLEKIVTEHPDFRSAAELCAKYRRQLAPNWLAKAARRLKRIISPFLGRGSGLEA